MNQTLVSLIIIFCFAGLLLFSWVTRRTERSNKRRELEQRSFQVKVIEIFVKNSDDIDSAPMYWAIYEFNGKRLESSHGFSDYQSKVGDLVAVAEEPKASGHYVEIEPFLRFDSFGDKSILVISVILFFVGMIYIFFKLRIG